MGRNDMNKNSTDLLTLLSLVRDVVSVELRDPVWVRAEIASVSVARNGHCYLELSQSEGGRVVAQTRAIIWAPVYRQIDAAFFRATESHLKAGLQLLFRASAGFDPHYGFSLTISDVDPDFTLGEEERKRAETLLRLQKEGLLDAQKEFVMCRLPYRIAVISARTAAGYGDFMKHLDENGGGYRFCIKLFQAPMQGEECARGIAAALSDVASSGERFDAVLILRGGGGNLDLAPYDEYEMCAAIARHPFPVITAVGHDRDVHLCDMVSYDSVKTPTALADLFLDIYAAEDEMLRRLGERLKNARRTRNAILEGRLDVLRARLEAADPRRLLEKGYVLVLDESDRPLRNASAAQKGDALTLMFSDGKLKVEVYEKEI